MTIIPGAFLTCASARRSRPPRCAQFELPITGGNAIMGRTALCKTCPRLPREDRYARYQSRLERRVGLPAAQAASAYRIAQMPFAQKGGGRFSSEPEANMFPVGSKLRIA